MDRSVYDIHAVKWGYFKESSAKTPGFKKLRALRKRLPLNNYHWERFDALNDGFADGHATDLRDGAGFVTFYSSCQLGYIARPGGAQPFISIDSVSDMHRRIRNKLNQKARNTPVNLGVALGEYRETAEFFVSAVRAVTRLVRDVKKFNYLDAVHSLGKGGVLTRSANAWLQWTYAVQPLAADVYGAVASLQSDKAFVDVKNIRCSERQLIAGVASGPVSKNQTTQIVGVMKGAGYLRFAVDNPFTFTLDQLGVHPAQWLSLGWELFPLSFVADWFFNIGAILQDIAPPQGVRFLEGSTSVSGAGRSDNLVTDASDPRRRWHAVSQELFKERIVLTQFPRYEIVVPDLGLSKKRTASALALMMQALRKKGSVL